MEILTEILTTTDFGDILLFLTTVRDINKMCNKLNRSTPFDVVALPYYGKLNKKYIKLFLIMSMLKKFSSQIIKIGLLRRIMNRDLNLIWIDLEMTGLSPSSDRIIEIATLVTDPELNIIAEGPNLPIKQSDQVLDGMDEWNRTHHDATGLIEKVKKSLISEREAEADTIEFLERYSRKNASPMCGNSICQDRRFLANYMLSLIHI